MSAQNDKEESDVKGSSEANIVEEETAEKGLTKEETTVAINDKAATDILKKQQTSASSAQTKYRNKLTCRSNGFDNLHLMKAIGGIKLNSRYQSYQDSHTEYCVAAVICRADKQFGVVI